MSESFCTSHKFIRTEMLIFKLFVYVCSVVYILSPKNRNSMNSFTRIISTITLLFCIFLASPSFAQEKEIAINQSFSSDTVFTPFVYQVAMYGMKLSGGITLLSDSSLVRVVLIDNMGNHFLIFETYPLITNVRSFNFIKACDETCYLAGIIPDSLRIDLIDAIFTLDTLYFSADENPDAISQQAKMKRINDSLKVGGINRQITTHNMNWRAGIT